MFHLFCIEKDPFLQSRKSVLILNWKYFCGRKCVLNFNQISHLGVIFQKRPGRFLRPGRFFYPPSLDLINVQLAFLAELLLEKPVDSIPSERYTSDDNFLKFVKDFLKYKQIRFMCKYTLFLDSSKNSSIHFFVRYNFRDILP